MVICFGLLLIICNHLGSTRACSFVKVSDPEKLIQSINLQVSCEDDNITVKMNTCSIEQMGYNPVQDISIAGFTSGPQSGKICSLQESIEGNFLTLVMTNLSACDTKSITTNDTVWYYNAVKNVGYSDIHSSGVIRRNRDIFLPFACEYRTKLTSIVGSYETKDCDVEIEVANKIGTTGLSVDLCFDTSCGESKIDGNDTVKPGDFLYLVVTSPSPRPIEITGFWATRDPDYYSLDNYIFVNDGCPQHFTTEVTSMKPFKSYISIVMIKWVPDEETAVYFHASVRLCNEDLGDRCIEPECEEPVRYKRSVVSSLTSTVEVHVTTIGPVNYIPKSEETPSSPHDV